MGEPAIVIPMAAMQAVAAGRVIEAIKLIREHLGVDLKTARQAVDSYLKQR